MDPKDEAKDPAQTPSAAIPRSLLGEPYQMVRKALLDGLKPIEFKMISYGMVPDFPTFQSMYFPVSGPIQGPEPLPPSFHAMEAFQKARAVIDQTTFPIKFEVVVEQLPTYFGDLVTQLRVCMDIKTREGGRDDKLTFNKNYAPSLRLTVVEAVKILRLVMKHIMQHEFDETMLVNGKRVFDPHGALPPEYAQARYNEFGDIIK